MVTMSRNWAILTAVTVLTLQLCTGQKRCSIWSSAGPVVQLGSTFQVYCSIEGANERFILSNHPPEPQKHKVFNSTTIFHEVSNITMNMTFSCVTSYPIAKDPCGTDIIAGYSPEQPKNISCTHNIINNETGVVICSWDKGRGAFLWKTFKLWVETVSGNHTAGPVSHKVISGGTEPPSASFNMTSSAQKISVWVQVENSLGSAKSIPVNYTLRDIARPSAPVLGQPECSSRRCSIKVEQSVRTQHLEVEYLTEAQTWTSAESIFQTSQAQVLSLEPFRLYYFRARSRFSTGLWSPWSTNTTGWTQEEAPAKELDVWHAEDSSDANLLKLYWKEPNKAMARGKIIQYKVTVHNQRDQNPIFMKSTSAHARNYTVPFCSTCEAKVWAYNSIGPSPPATVTIMHTKDQPLQGLGVNTNNQSVAISWRKNETAPLPAEYVVEWYPEGRKLEELRWVRLGWSSNRFVVTDIRPAECFEGAVYVFYNDSSVGRTRFTAVFMESVPTVGPSVQENVDGKKVTITWTEIPWGQRGGCIISYTIYLEDSSGHLQHYFVQTPEKTFTVLNQPPGVYSLWMTASTAEGAGPAGQKVKFFIAQEAQQYPVIVCAIIFPVALFLLCLWQCSAVKQRFWGLFECLMLDAVLDPANSKWAKECTQEKGKMNLQLPQSPSIVAEEEEEPILADVEEMPNQGSQICTLPVNTTQLSPETSLSPLMERTRLHYPLTTYIKSFSHDSESSDHTETSLDTNSTVDYISSHGPGGMDEEDEEEEEEFPEICGFISSHSIFMQPLQVGGNLTLDAVKIDCTDFFQNM